MPVSDPGPCRRAALFAVAFLLVLLVLLPTATAHGDRRIEAATHTVDPGETIRLEVALHYHRLVGSYSVQGDAGPVTVAIERVGTMDPVVLANGTGGKLHHFVACCDGITWAEHELVVTNPNDEPVEVSLEARFLHDDLVVIAHDAETGAGIQSALSFGILGGVFAYRAHRRRARAIEPETARTHLARSRIYWGTMAGIAALGMVIGMIRYGTGPLAGGITTAATIPHLPGPIGHATLSMVLLIVLWGFSLHHWAQAHGTGMQRRAMLTWGGVLIAGAALIVALLVVEHGGTMAPLLVGAFTVAPLAVAWVQDARTGRPRHAA